MSHNLSMPASGEMSSHKESQQWLPVNALWGFCLTDKFHQTHDALFGHVHSF